jgi:hypothetical protein
MVQINVELRVVAEGVVNVEVGVVDTAAFVTVADVN